MKKKAFTITLLLAALSLASCGGSSRSSSSSSSSRTDTSSAAPSSESVEPGDSTEPGSDSSAEPGSSEEPTSSEPDSSEEPSGSSEEPSGSSEQHYDSDSQVESEDSSDSSESGDTSSSTGEEEGSSESGDTSSSAGEDEPDWTDDEKALMAEYLHGLVLPYAEDVTVTFNQDYGTIDFEGGFMDDVDITAYASYYPDYEGWAGGDISSDLNLPDGVAYRFEKAVETDEGTRYVQVTFYLAGEDGYPSSKGYFYLYAYDPYFYEFPTQVVTYFAYALTLDENAPLIPEVEASHYDYSLENFAIYCFVDSDTDDAGYGDILKAAGWTIQEELDNYGYYVAISPDESYQIAYLYDDAYGSLDIFFEENASLPADWSASEKAEMAYVDGMTLPYFDVDVLSATYDADDETFYMLGYNVDLDDLAEYAAAFEEAGWEGGDVSAYNEYPDGYIYRYGHWVETEEGDRYVMTFFFIINSSYQISSSGYLYLYAYDPYLYEFPVDYAGIFASAVSGLDEPELLPALDADFYIADEDNLALYCYLDSETDDAGYGDILKAAGWTVLEEKNEEGYYVAVSPDQSYQISYLYDADYEDLDIYFESFDSHEHSVLDFNGEWTEEQKAEMANIDGIELPYIGLAEAEVEYDDYYEAVFVTGGYLDLSQLAQIAAVFEADEWEGGDISERNGLPTGSAYYFEKAIETEEGIRRVSVSFYLVDEEADIATAGSLYLYVQDPYYYEFPADSAFTLAYYVSDNIDAVEVPAFDADYYEVSYRNYAIYCYVDADTDDAGYSAILEAAGWTVLEDRDSYGYYVAISPDQSYQISYLYDEDYGDLDIYFDEYTPIFADFPSDEANALAAAVAGDDDVEPVPAYEGADSYEINEDYLLIRCYVDADTDDAGYSAILEAAGWTVLEDRDSYGYYVAVSPDGSYQLSYLYSTYSGALVIYVEEYIEPIVEWPNDAAEEFVSYVSDSDEPILPPAYAGAEEYVIYGSSLMILCYVDAETDDAGYSAILEEAGWTVLEDRGSSGYYVAVSPDGSYQLSYLYIGSYGALAVYFEEFHLPITEWPTDDIAALVSLVSDLDEPAAVPAIESSNYEVYPNDSAFLVTLDSETDDAGYSAILEEAGWTVLEDRDSYGYYVAVSPDGSYQLSYLYSTRHGALIVYVEEHDSDVAGWTDEEKAEMAYVDGVELPFFGEGALEVEYDYYYDRVYVRGGAFDVEDLLDIAIVFEEAGWSVQDVSEYNDLPAGYVYYVSTWVEAEGGEVCVIGMLYLIDEDGDVSDEGSLYGYFYDPYYYEFPAEEIDSIIYYVASAGDYALPPEFEADYYEVSSRYSAVICYVDADTDDAGYSAILEEAGWILLDEKDSSGYYVAISPDYSYQIFYLYGEDYGSLDIYFVAYVESLDEWPTDDAAAFAAEISGSDSPIVPPAYEGADSYEINEDYLLIRCYVDSDTDDAGYSAILEEAGWTVLEERDSYGYYVAISPDETYQISYLYSDDYGVLRIYFEQYNKPLDYWDTDKIAESFVAWDAEPYDVPAFVVDGAAYTYYDDEYNDLYAYFDASSYMNTNVLISGVDQEDYEGYVAALIEAGWVVTPIESETLVGVSATFAIGAYGYNIGVAFDAEEGTALLTLYFFPSIITLTEWPSEGLADALFEIYEEEFTDAAPVYTGENEGFFLEENLVFVFVEQGSEQEGAEAYIALLIESDFTAVEGEENVFVSPNAELQVTVSYVENYGCFVVVVEPVHSMAE